MQCTLAAVEYGEDIGDFVVQTAAPAGGRDYGTDFTKRKNYADLPAWRMRPEFGRYDMDFKDVVMKRRSIRKYTDEPVSDEDLQYLLECGMSAPSAVNLQPWYFVVIRSKEQMVRLCEVMSDSSDKLSDDLHALFKSHPEVVEETLSFLRKLGGAPIVILAFRHKPSYPKKDDAIVQSVSAALENIALAAVDRGLGSCWMTAPMETADDTRLREMFAPECGEMVALMTIGHPAQDPRPIPHKKGRYVII